MAIEFWFQNIKLRHFLKTQCPLLATIHFYMIWPLILLCNNDHKKEEIVVIV